MTRKSKIMKRQTRNKRRRTKTPKRSKNKKYTKKMSGGDFSIDEKNQLINLGFTQEHINLLEQHPFLNYRMVTESLQQINPATGNRFTPAEIIESMLDVQNENMLDISNISDEGSQHDISIGSINRNNDSMNTTRESFSSFGTLNSSDNGSGLNPSDLDMSVSRSRSLTIGGKKYKGRKSRKQKGGMCYGTGVGANCYDPNFSIYNTRELTLFPYKPIK